MAVLFDNATQQYFETNAIGNIPTAPALTMVYWFDLDETPSSANFMIAALQRTTPDNNYFRCMSEGASTNLEARQRSTAANSSSAKGFISQDTWHHGAAVYASTTSRTCYLDGSAGSEGTTSVTTTAPQELLIGAWDDATSLTWSGRIAEFGIYDKALTGAEITNLSTNKWAPEKVAAGNLVHYWKFINWDDTDEVGSLTLSAPNGNPSTAAHPPGIVYASSGDLMMMLA